MNGNDINSVRILKIANELEKSLLGFLVYVN